MRRVKFKVVSMGWGSRRFSAFAEGKYNLEYPKNEIVRAIEGTFGVAVFKTKKQAEDFQESLDRHRIIHVRPVGRGRNIEFISDNATEFELDDFYNEKPSLSRILGRAVPPGTMFYPAVEVLD